MHSQHLPWREQEVYVQVHLILSLQAILNPPKKFLFHYIENLLLFQARMKTCRYVREDMRGAKSSDYSDRLVVSGIDCCAL